MGRKNDNVLRKAIWISLIGVFVFLGKANGQFNIVGAAVSSSSGCYTLTSNTSEAGAVWNTKELNLTNSFDIILNINFGSITADDHTNPPCGGDGMSFVLQSVSSGLGGTGDGMGFDGITPSIGVVMDDYENGADNDPAYDHMSLNKNGDIVHLTSNELVSCSTTNTAGYPSEVEDGNDHTFRFQWTASTKTINVWFDGTQMFSYTGDIVSNIFSGNPEVYWGFAASTGACYNIQKICLGISADFSYSTACAGNATSFTDLSSSTSPITSYAWDFGDGQTSADTNPTHIYDAPGTYNVQLAITNNVGLTSTVTYSLTIDGSDLTMGSPLTLTCSTTSGTISASSTTGGVSYSWAGPGIVSGDGTSTPTVNAAGTYTVTVTVASCNRTGTVTVSSNTTQPDVTMGAALNLTCAVTSGTISASSATGGVTYNWAGPGIVSGGNTSIPTVNTAGTYTVTVTNPANGCTNTANTTVTQSSLPTAYSVSGGGSYCTGGTGLSVCVSLSQVGVDYQLQCNGVNTGAPLAGTGSALCFTNLTTTGTYTVVATNPSTSCVNNMNGNATISISSPPIADAGVDISIPYGTYTTLNGSASGGSGSYSYSWTPADSLVNATNQNPTTTNLFSSTTFTLTVLDWASGCSGTDQVNITLSGVPINISTLTATPNSICYGASTQLNAFATGGNGSYTYSWTSNPAGFTSNITNPVISPTITTIYTVVANDNFNTTSASITVTVNPNPVASAGNDTMMCSGFNLNLNASGAGAGGSYAWSPGTFLSATNVYNPVSTPTSGITYIVTVTDANGCKGTDDIKITLYNTEYVNAGIDQTICNGHEAYLNASGGQSFVWSPASTLSSSTISNPIATPTTNTTYYVTATDNHGCTSMDDVVVNVVQNVTAIVSNDTTICYGSAITLSAAGGTNYYWSPAAGLSSTTVANPTASPQSTTTYYVTVSNGVGCSDIAKVIITVKESPNISAGTDVAICNGASIQLHASGGDSYIWQPNTNLNSNIVADPIANPQTTTTYTVTTIGVNGCSASDNIIVNVHQLPNIDAGQSTSICKYQNIQLVATGGYYYSWSNGEHNDSTLVNPTSTTVYSVTSTDLNGCVNTDNVTITVLPFEPPVISADGPVSFCDNAPIDVNLISTSGYNTYQWSNSAATSSIHVTTAGSYYCIAALSNGCSDTSNVIIVGNYQSPDPPVILADGPTNFCEGDSIAVNLYTADQYSVYQWSSGSSTSMIHVTSMGYYSVTVTDIHGCSAASTTSAQITFTPNPVAYMNYGSNGLTINFYDFSLNGETYLWNFGDGSTSQLQNPVHIYPAAGTYTVTFIVYNQCGSDTAVVDIYVTNGAGIDEEIIVNNFSVYPVPAKDYLNIGFEYNSSDNIKVQISNVLGQKIFYEDVDNSTGIYSRTIDFSDVPAGMYFISVKTDKVIFNKKILKE
ncbi:MAG TPA: PKD domain-containing protein [Bacteroidales bacterium]|nr:PKD domain-containing protein [Bacteroidales bacterium]HPS15581.1 PKD domain-containing protein [Bacteroidales bacterium]